MAARAALGSIDVPPSAPVGTSVGPRSPADLSVDESVSLSGVINVWSRESPWVGNDGALRAGVIRQVANPPTLQNHAVKTSNRPDEGYQAVDGTAAGTVNGPTTAGTLPSH